MTFFNSDKPVLFPDITYSFYPVWAEMLRINYKTLPLDENFCIRPEDYKEPNGGVIFPNPNAPTAIEGNGTAHFAYSYGTWNAQDSAEDQDAAVADLVAEGLDANMIRFDTGTVF